MDYPIRTISASLEKPHYFYAEPVRNGSAAYLLAASTLKCWRKKQLLPAICITFHTNFTIRPGGHSNFAVPRRFPSAVSRPASGVRSSQISISLSIYPQSRRTGNPGTHFTALPSLHPASRSVRPSPWRSPSRFPAGW